MADVVSSAPAADEGWHELLPVLDEEVSRLPDKYRLPVVLCYFGGKTYTEAARTLGLAEGTIASRLARARGRLRRRLSRRGSAVSGGLMIGALSEATAPATPPAALVGATALAARSLASGAVIAGPISANVISLTKGVLQSMFIANLKTIAGVVLALGIVGTGTGVWWHGAMSEPGADDTLAQSGNQQPPAGVSAPRPPTAEPQPPSLRTGASAGRVLQPAKGQPKPPVGNKDAVASSAAPLASGQLRQRLEQPVRLEFDNNTLTDALHLLSERFDIPILVDSEAFRNDLGINDVRNQQITLPNTEGVKLRMALRLVLSQIQGDFQLRDGALFILPFTRVTSDTVVLQPVDASFHEAPLNVALQKLSDLTGVSVVLDARTAEKTQVAVTAELNNVPLLDAVRVLSDMAGLRPVALDNVLYVTTPANASQMETDKAAHPRPPRRWNW